MLNREQLGAAQKSGQFKGHHTHSKADLDTIDRVESNVRGYVRKFPTVFKSAVNSVLVDREEREYIDFFCGAGSLNYGHNNAVAKQAILQYVESDGIQHSLDTATEAKVAFIDAFEKTILQPRGLDYKIQFTGPTGTNAVEAAIKLARKKTQRSHIISFTHAYHGHTLGSLALTANAYYHSEYYGARNNVSHLPYDGYVENFDSAAYLEKLLADNSSGTPLPAAVILETVQGEGGINIASDAWLRSIEQICKTYGILLIIDDIQVGNGRTGRFFSFEHSKIKPDIVCLSKSLGGGLPLSINLISPALDVWQPGEHTGTFRGNNLAFVAATALLDYWCDATFEESIATRSAIIEARLKSIATANAGKGFSYRGKGMIWGLDVGKGAIASDIIDIAFRSGLLIESSGASDEVLKIMAALTIELDLLKDGLDRLEAAVTAALDPMQSSVSVVKDIHSV